MNRLNRHTVYLAGSIDESKNTAHLWREEMTKFLQPMGIGVFNPCDKPCGIPEDEGFVDFCNELKSEEQWEVITKEMVNVVRADLHMVDLSNFMIAAIDKDRHLCGSYSEVTYAALEKKPVILWCPQGKKAVPNWLWGMGLRHEIFFETLEEVKEYITHIHTAERVDTLQRWRFVDYGKVFGQ